MEKVPDNVMIEEILLKLPVKSLLSLRYVSKDLWRLITSPSFIKLHLRHSSIAQLNNNNNNNNNPNSLLISCRHLALRKRDGGVLGTQLVIHNYDCNFPISITTSSPKILILPEIVEMHLPFESTEIRASCNGLLYLHQRLISWINGNKIDDISYYIWNPCTKEYKQLTPPPPPLLVDGVDVGNLNNGKKFNRFDYSSSSGFCGFGYDRNNDEYKILHYENRVHPNYFVVDDVRLQLSISSIIEFKLYTLGTNTWTRIADNPYSSFYFKETSQKIGLLVNGALHWIMALLDPTPKASQIISFDIEKEVFREIQKPRYYSSKEEEEEEEEEERFYFESLQILQECLCMCQVHFHGAVKRIDIWMLQDYYVMDSWTKLFTVVIPGEEKFNYYQFRLLRYCENGEIVILRNYKDVIVYDPANHKARCAKKFNESIAKWGKYYTDYTESLVCLNSGTYTDRTS